MANLDDLRIDSPMPRPRRQRGSPLPAILVLLVGAALAWYFFGDRIKQAKVALAPAREVQVFTVPAAAAGPPGSFTAGGYLEVIPPGPTVASALINGQVRELAVKPGDRVRAGQIVARLDDSLLAQDVAVQASQVELARANLARMNAGFRSEELDQSRAELAQAQARMDKALADHSRYTELLAQGVVSRAEFDAYESALAQAEGEVQARQSALSLLEAGQRSEDIAIAGKQLDAARAELARAQTLASKATIKSPVDGVVLNLYVQPGGWVSPTDGREHAGAVCSIFDPRQVQAWADVNQRDIGKVSVGQDIVLATDAAPDEKLAGRVAMLSPSANLQKNTVQVKVAIDKPPAYLRPEMSVQITFQPKSVENAEVAVTGFELPATAILREGATARVLILSGGKAQGREVQLGAEHDGKVLVIAGVSAGDQVIVDPEGIGDGQGVKVKEAAKP